MIVCFLGLVVTLVLESKKEVGTWWGPAVISLTCWWEGELTMYTLIIIFSFLFCTFPRHFKDGICFVAFFHWFGLSIGLIPMRSLSRRGQGKLAKTLVFGRR